MHSFASRRTHYRSTDPHELYQARFPLARPAGVCSIVARNSGAMKVTMSTPLHASLPNASIVALHPLHMYKNTLFPDDNARASVGQGMGVKGPKQHARTPRNRKNFTLGWVLASSMYHSLTSPLLRDGRVRGDF